MDSGQKWEYFVLGYTMGQGKHGPCWMSMDNMSISDSLKDMGADGWELVSSCFVPRGDGNKPEVMCFFKRPKA
jgi:hypothetical protein